MFINVGIDLNNVNNKGDTAMMMAGLKNLFTPKTLKLFFEAGAKSCFINKAKLDLVECF